MTNAMALANRGVEKSSECNRHLVDATNSIRIALAQMAAAIKASNDAAEAYSEAGFLLISSHTSTGQELARMATGRAQNIGPLQDQLSAVLVPLDNVMTRGHDMQKDAEEWIRRVTS